MPKLVPQYPGRILNVLIRVSSNNLVVGLSESFAILKNLGLAQINDQDALDVVVCDESSIQSILDNPALVAECEGNLWFVGQEMDERLKSFRKARHIHKAYSGLSLLGILTMLTAFYGQDSSLSVKIDLA